VSDQQAILKKIDMRQNQASLGDRIGILYNIRCDVVHEGHYWDFQFATDEHPSVFTGFKEQVLRVRMKYEEFRDIVAGALLQRPQRF
jgi:hypothetical protein